MSRNSYHPYEEEESYENPVNLSKDPRMQDNSFDIRSEYVPGAGLVNVSMGVYAPQQNYPSA